MYRVLIAMALLTLPATFLSTWSAACTPPPRPVRSEWIAKNIRLPSETSAQPGNYSFAGREYLREIIDAIDDHEVRRITMLGGTQIGKTELIKALILSQGEVARAPMMFAGPDQVYVREQREVIYRMAEASPALAGRIPPPRMRNDRWIDLEKCLVYLAWSGSRQRLSGRACKVVLCSEADGWQDPLGKPGSRIRLALERTKAFPDNYCTILEGTPVGASPILEDSYGQSDRRTYHVACPECGQWQELRFFPHRTGPYAGNGGVSGMRDPSQAWLSPTAARVVAYYLCERGCKIDASAKAGLVARGRWVRDGESIDDRGRVVGTPKNPCRHRGYRCPSILSPTITLGDMAEAYLLLRDQPGGLERFFNDWLGLKFEPRGKTPKWKDLGERLGTPQNTPRGMVPRWAWFLTAGCDVQSRGVYWSVRAWGDRKTSQLVDFGFIEKPLLGSSDPDDPESWTPEVLAGDMAQIDAVILQRRWPVDGQNPRGLSALAIRVLGIDRGYRPRDVDAFKRAHPGDRVMVVVGDPKIRPGELWRPHRLDRDPKTGERLESSIEFWGIETNAYKTEIADRWLADPRQLGVWWLPSDILTTPAGEDYLRQITSETRTFDRLHGRKRVQWELISHGLANHYWDCETYQCSLADMVVGSDWDATHWAALLRPARPPTEAGADPVSAREFSSEDFSAR